MIEWKAIKDFVYNVKKLQFLSMKERLDIPDVKNVVVGEQEELKNLMNKNGRIQPNEMEM